jgi:hypothetical protein
LTTKSEFFRRVALGRKKLIWIVISVVVTVSVAEAIIIPTVIIPMTNVKSTIANTTTTGIVSRQQE